MSENSRNKPDNLSSGGSGAIAYVEGKPPA